MIKCDIRTFRCNFWIFEVFSGNSDASQRCSANASRKAPHIFRAFLSASPSHFNLRPGAVSMAVRANSALAFSAKHRGVALAKPLYRHRSLNRMRPSKFFEEPLFCLQIARLPNGCGPPAINYQLSTYWQTCLPPYSGPFRSPVGRKAIPLG